MILRYDTDTLKAVAVNEGDLMRRPGIKANFDGQIDEAGGMVSIDLAAEGGGTVSGTGNIASIQFEVIGSDKPAAVSISNIVASSGDSASVAVVSALPMSIEIQPQP